MTDKKSKNEPDALNKAIDRILAYMESITPNSEEYAKMVGMLDTLYKIKANEKRPPSVDVTAILSIVGNLAGIGLILKHEQLHVIASKALGFVTKTRI